MKRLLSLGFVLAALTAAPHAADATIITQSRDFRALSFASITGPADARISTNVTFAAFDPTLGTLERVELLLEGFAAFSGTLTCTGPTVVGTCNGISALTQLLLRIDGPLEPFTLVGERLFEQLPLGSTAMGALSPVGGGFTVEAHEVPDTEGIFADTSQFLAGPMSFEFEAFSGFFSTTSPLGVVLDRNEFNGTATLSYIFSEATDAVAVPAPASLPLFTAGLAALGFAGWCKRRNERDRQTA